MYNLENEALEQLFDYWKYINLRSHRNNDYRIDGFCLGARGNLQLGVVDMRGAIPIGG